MANNRINFVGVTATDAAAVASAQQMAKSATASFGRREQFHNGHKFTVEPYDPLLNYVCREGHDEDEAPTWPVLRIRNLQTNAVENIFLKTLSESLEDGKSMEDITLTGSFNVFINSLRGTAPTIEQWLQAICAQMAGKQIVCNKQTIYWRAFRDGSLKKSRATMFDIDGQPTVGKNYTA